MRKANIVARDLRTPKYRKRVVEDKKAQARRMACRKDNYGKSIESYS